MCCPLTGQSGTVLSGPTLQEVNLELLRFVCGHHRAVRLQITPAPEARSDYLTQSLT